MQILKHIANVNGWPVMYDAQRQHYFVICSHYPESSWRAGSLKLLVKAMSRRKIFKHRPKTK